MGLSGFADTGKGPLAWVAGYTVVPMQKGINRVGMWISDVSDNFATLQEVREENKQLRNSVEADYFQSSAPQLFLSVVYFLLSLPEALQNYRTHH